MKKIALIAIALTLLISATLSAQFIEDMDGHDWLQFSVAEQRMYLVGFYAAHSSIWIRMSEEMYDASGMIERDTADALHDFFYIWMTVSDLRDVLNIYFRQSPANRRTTIIEAINLAIGFW